ncbi:hypothetical protein BsWGS_09087 [Bradybaena similaris]
MCRDLLLPLVVVAINLTGVYNLCERKEIIGNLAIPDHLPLPVRYNVCVDNTTIYPEPSLVRTAIATFVRECCGCRVSSVSERELRIHRISPTSESRSIYVPEIRACECIPCDNNIYTWSDYFLYLDHKRRK